MISKFKQYNESIRDKMVGKNFDEFMSDPEEFEKYIKILVDIGFKVYDYSFYDTMVAFTCDDKISDKNIKIFYYYNNRWSLTINTPAQVGWGSTDEFKFKSFDEMMEIIVEHIHPNLDDEIHELKQKLDFLQKLKKIK